MIDSLIFPDPVRADSKGYIGEIRTSVSLMRLCLCVCVFVCFRLRIFVQSKFPNQKRKLYKVQKIELYNFTAWQTLSFYRLHRHFLDASMSTLWFDSFTLRFLLLRQSFFLCIVLNEMGAGERNPEDKFISLPPPPPSGPPPSPLFPAWRQCTATCWIIIVSS